MSVTLDKVAVPNYCDLLNVRVDERSSTALGSRPEAPDRDDMDAVLASAGDSGACDDAEGGRFAMPAFVHVRREAEESGGRIIDVAWVELDLEGGPLVVVDGDYGVDFVAVLVAPRFDGAVVGLGEDAQVTHYEGLEMEAGGKGVCA